MYFIRKHCCTSQLLLPCIQYDIVAMSGDEGTVVRRHPLRDEEQGSVTISPGLHILLQILAGAARDSWYKAERIHRSELAKRYGNAGRFRESSGNIAAIDFGTTFCSLAYTTPGDKISTLKLEEYYPRVPSAILLKEKEQSSVETSQVAKTPSYEVVCFGYEAQEQHSKIRPSERTRHLYFERFKMTLQHDEVYTYIDRHTTYIHTYILFYTHTHNLHTYIHA